MPIPSALLLAAALLGDSLVHHGRRGETVVRPPRVEAVLTVDGRLDEAVWQRAAILTGFSQFSPQDGIAAADSTEVLVWHSASAIHFGIRAYEAHGGAAVIATLAERDRIAADDQVQILLGTFNDGRQATMLAVNPLGIQADGSLVEQGNRASGGFLSSASAGREVADLSQDYVYQSKGRVTPYGYEVEIRVPFKSLRFQQGPEQTWGLNIVRRVQHANHEDSWTPAERGRVSFLAQSGTLVGMRDLRRGLVLDVTPELTGRWDGAPGVTRWAYGTGRGQLGANVRMGLSNNLTFNATLNPDFSQVEADAGQVNFDPRRQIQIPERRPFFIDGIEQFQTPNGLVYTRRIVRPEGAAKVAGKIGGTNVALLSAIDDPTSSRSGHDRPSFQILRVARDLGRQSRLAMTYTQRADGDALNRVMSVDGRAVLSPLWSATGQLALASDRLATGQVTTAPLLQFTGARDGRAFGLRSSFRAVSPDFVTRSGFISRPGETQASLTPRLTWFGGQGARIETATAGLTLDALWNYDRFVARGDARDKKFHVNGDLTIRGGWTIGSSILLETFGYDPTYYGPRYRVEAPTAAGGRDTLAFVGTPRLPNRDYVLRLGTPRFKRWQASAFFIQGIDENFYEWSSARILYAQVTVNARPSERLRIDGTFQIQEYVRDSDGTLVGLVRNPRVKLEYQLSRFLFVRGIGEYFAEYTDALRDDGRTGHPLLVRNASGTFVRTVATTRNALRGDLLVAYTPVPGTVVYLGYGSRMTEPQSFHLARVVREQDVVFLKASYLFRR
jgi:hypothetical protein